MIEKSIQMIVCRQSDIERHCIESADNVRIRDKFDVAGDVVLTLEIKHLLHLSNLPITEPAGLRRALINY
jgi:hypothetical protein